MSRMRNYIHYSFRYKYYKCISFLLLFEHYDAILFELLYLI